MKRFCDWVKVVLALLLTIQPLSGFASTVRKVTLPLVADLKRADIYVSDTAKHPTAVLVLSPGCNGNGESLASDATWQRFASENRFGLLGLSFASDEALLRDGRGYYYASRGSGDVLLRAIRTVYGSDLPLFLYGFSGGAHFTSRFAEWRPHRVVAWCAYSAAWWDDPRRRPAMPPGIVACGEDDGARYGASLTFFLQGRALGKPWTWVSLARTGHARSATLDTFVRSYFPACLRGAPPGNPSASREERWCDVETKEPILRAAVSAQPTLASWLPTEDVARRWRVLHHP